MIRAQLKLKRTTVVEDLARAAPRLALVVEAMSARRDVREARASVLVVLRSLSCPVGGRPRRSWYVQGAAARVSAAVIRRAWWGVLAEDPPCERTVSAHLRALERALAIVRAPGDLLPTMGLGAHRPRYPDTVYLLEDERDARWWASDGLLALARCPDARRSAARWRELFSGWRGAARARQLELNFDQPAAPVAAGASTAVNARSGPRAGFIASPESDNVLPHPSAPGARVDRAEGRRRAARVAAALELDPLDLLFELARAGAPLSPRGQLEVLSRPARLRQAAALYALALSRGDVVRSGPGWLRAMFRRASDPEGLAAIAFVRKDLP